MAQGMPVVIVVSLLDDHGASPPWVAVAAGARLVPYVVCSPIAGALAARVPMGAVCRATCACRLVILAALTLLVDASPHPLVLAASLFLLTTAGTPVYPSLVAATRAVVPHGRLTAANAITASVESAAFVAGPALAGLLLTASGYREVMLVACLLMSMALLIAGRGPIHRPSRTSVTGKEGLRNTVSSGARALGSHSARPAVVTLLAVNVLAGLETVALVAVAGLLPDADTAGYATLAAASGAGAVFGVALALVGQTRRHLPDSPSIFVVVAALSLAGLAVVDNLAVAAVIIGVAGTAAMLAEVSAIGHLQRRLGAVALAAAFGLLDSVIVLAMLAGAGIAPIAIETVGARPALLLSGTALASLALLAPPPPSASTRPRGSRALLIVSARPCRQHDVHAHLDQKPQSTPGLAQSSSPDRPRSLHPKSKGERRCTATY